MACFLMGYVSIHVPTHDKSPSKNIRNKREFKHIENKKKHIVSTVTVTCYQPIKQQCDSEPLTTSDGSKINLNNLKNGHIKWCAISRDLLYLFPKNRPKRVSIEGFGVYEVRDVTNKRFKHRVDILVHPKNSKKILLKNVKIKIL